MPIRGEKVSWEFIYDGFKILSMEAEYAYSDGTANKHIQERIYAEAFALSLLGFLIPFTFGHPQLLVGVLVNAFIIRAALTLPTNRALPVLFTPTLGVLSRGLLFGPYTPYIIYMTPFIWIGNYVLYWAMKSNALGKSSAIKLAIGSCAKAAFLYSTAYVLYTADILPALFLPAMGVFQFATAVAGGILVLGYGKVKRS